MDFDTILAHLNLHAVLPNLEELVKNDAPAAEIAAGRDIRIRFVVRHGPRARVTFHRGACRIDRESPSPADVILFFTSCGHLNRMFAGRANPIPLKGFTRIGYLTKEFKAITDRLEYYLDPTKGDQQDPDYRKLNTLLTLDTAGRAVPVLARGDKAVKAIAAGLPEGTLMIKVLPEGPAVHLTFSSAGVVMGKGEVERPAAAMLLKDIPTAFDLLNQKLNPFAAIAAGDIMIRGQLPLIDAVDLILDRIPHYLAP